MGGKGEMTRGSIGNITKEHRDKGGLRPEELCCSYRMEDTVKGLGLGP